METFKGGFDELKAFIATCDLDGEWSDLDNGGKQFRAENGACINWWVTTGRVQVQGKQGARDEVLAALATAQGLAPPSPSAPAATKGHTKQKVFVVHGHDSVAREQLELVLHKLGLDPFILANTSGGGLTIIEALEAQIGKHPDAARFGIVLMTPDDVGYAKKDGQDKAEPRARQNVVLEMGMLMSALGRSNVAILKKGHLEVPSDANGILYIGFNEHVKETVPRLSERLSTAGFKVDASALTKAAS